MEYKYETAYKVWFIVRDNGWDKRSPITKYFKDKDKAIAFAKDHDDNSIYTEIMAWYIRGKSKDDLRWFEHEKGKYISHEFVCGYVGNDCEAVIEAFVDEIIIEK